MTAEETETTTLFSAVGLTPPDMMNEWQKKQSHEHVYLKRCKAECAEEGFCCGRDSGCNRPSCSLGCEVAHQSISQAACKAACQLEVVKAASRCHVKVEGFAQATTCGSCERGAQHNGTCRGECEEEQGCDSACNYFFAGLHRDCIVTGYYYKPQGSLRVWSGGMSQCQSLCNDNMNCYHFSYWPDDKTCVQHLDVFNGEEVYLYNASEECDVKSGTTSRDDRDCKGDRVMSGPKACGENYYDWYPNVMKAVGPSGAYDSLAWTTSAAPLARPSPEQPEQPPKPSEQPGVESDEDLGAAPSLPARGSAGPAGPPTEVVVTDAADLDLVPPPGYSRQAIMDHAEAYEEAGEEDARNAAVVRCIGDPRCTGVYHTGTGTWKFLTGGEEEWPECCKDACRDTGSLEASYCVEPIFRKISPPGFARGTAEHAAKLEVLGGDNASGEVANLTQEHTLSACSASDDCVGVYLAANGRWIYLQEGGERFPECCEVHCRTAGGLPADYCAEPIYQKNSYLDAAPSLARERQEDDSSFWPFPWWVWLVGLLLCLLAGLGAYLASGVGGKKGKSGKNKGSKPRTRHAKLEDGKTPKSKYKYQALQESPEPEGPESDLDLDSPSPAGGCSVVRASSASVLPVPGPGAQTKSSSLGSRSAAAGVAGASSRGVSTAPLEAVEASGGSGGAQPTSKDAMTTVEPPDQDVFNQLFNVLDRNHDGVLTREEMDVLTNMPVFQQQQQQQQQMPLLQSLPQPQPQLQVMPPAYTLPQAPPLQSSYRVVQMPQQMPMTTMLPTVVQAPSPPVQYMSSMPTTQHVVPAAQRVVYSTTTPITSPRF